MLPELAFQARRIRSPVAAVRGRENGGAGKRRSTAEIRRGNARKQCAYAQSVAKGKLRMYGRSIFFRTYSKKNRLGYFRHHDVCGLDEKVDPLLDGARGLIRLRRTSNMMMGADAHDR